MNDDQCMIQQQAKYVCWFEELKSPTRVQRRLRPEFGGGNHQFCPSRMSINRWHEKFFETGSILRSNMIGMKSVRTDEMETAVVATFQEDSHMFLWQAGNKFSISKDTFRQILRDHNFHPYKMQTVQQLSEEDKEDRMTFARNELYRTEDVFDHLHGGVSRHNFRY